uniref:Uncharacterized protein n=1 Tax=Bracon brevicornis TaxID=1563983 RepID=A0A6V7IHF5_9HYME
MAKYQLNVRLRRMAAIQIAKYLWRHSQLSLAVKRIKNPNEDDFYPRMYSRNSVSPTGITMEQVYNSLTSIINQLPLPDVLKEEVRFVVASMGKHINTYLELLINREYRNIEYEFDKHVDHLHWTCLGTIDQTETVRSMYQANVLEENYSSFKKLSYYCADDCIRDVQPKVSKDDVRVTDTSFNISPLRFAFPWIMPFYWDRHLKNREAEVIAQLVHSCNEMRYYDYDEAYSLNENLFIMSVLAGNYWSLRYFWNLLDDNQKSRAMSKMANSHNCQKQIEEQWVAKDIEVIVFLLQQLSHYQLHNLLIIMLGSDVVICKLLNWPWYSIFFEVLEDLWMYHPKFNYAPIISGLLGAVKEVKRIPNVCRDYCEIFQKIWYKNPGDMKKKLDYEQIISEAIRHQAIAGLAWIINCYELSNRRRQFVDCARQAFKGSYEDRKALDEFLNTVLISEEEREPFRNEVIAEYEERKIQYKLNFLGE